MLFDACEQGDWSGWQKDLRKDYIINYKLSSSVGSLVLHCGWLPAVTIDVKETKPAKNSGQVAAGKTFLKMLQKSG